MGFCHLEKTDEKNHFFFAVAELADACRTRLMEEDPDIQGAQIQDHFKYIGVYLGRVDDNKNWNGPLSTFIQAVHFLISIDCGLNTTIMLHNMLAVSQLSYVASFIPSSRALATEKWALQKLLNGPWNAIPAEAMHCLRGIGLSFEARRLACMSRASMVRSAAITAPD